MRLVPAVFVILLSVALTGCHKPKAQKPHAASAAQAPPPPLPVVKAEDVPAPAKTEVTLEKGMTLATVAKEAYGHEKFSGMLLKFNEIADPARIKAGTVIKTPSIPLLFQTAGMDAKYQPAINALALAVHDYFALLPDYRALRTKAATGISAGPAALKLTIPAEMKTKLDHAADAVASAAALFAGAAAPHKPPMATVTQFRQAATQMRALASGTTDGTEYEDDIVGQRLGAGMTNALIWLQQQYQ